MCKTSITPNQPFGMSLEKTWLISVLLPIIIAILGWIAVYIINKKNMKNEKRVIIKLQAYDYIKNMINQLENDYVELYSFISSTYTTISNLAKNNDLYEMYKTGFLNDFDNDVFNKLKNKSNISFVNFTSAWMQYEIVFKSLDIQRYALEVEFNNILNELTLTFTDYHRYALFIKSINNVDDNDRIELLKKMEISFKHVFDFYKFINNVNFNIQNFVFSDILKDPIRVKQSNDNEYPTIEKLIEKHKIKIQELYNIDYKNSKGIFKKIWYRTK